MMESDRASAPVVSVVVPTRNNRRTIEACLQSVRAQTYSAIELITVDNSSTDGTDEISRRIADVATTAGPERSAQRNLGFELARGEWVLWLDSDMVLPPTAVAVAMDTALSTGAVGVALPERTVGDGFLTSCRALERECYLDVPELHNPRLLPREFMVRGGRFDLSMSGPEDTDLRLRMRSQGLRVELAPIIIDHDEGRLTLRDVLSKRYYYGRSIPALASVHDDAVSGQGRAIVKAYVRGRRRLARKPIQAIAMLGLRSLEAAAYLLGASRGRRDTRA